MSQLVASSSQVSRRWQPAMVLLLVSLILIWKFLPADMPNLPLYDFVEYWAAGRLNATGQNPYDIDRMRRLEEEVGRDSETVLMWNPPWTLAVAMPFGLLPVRPAHWLWLLMQFAVLIFSADLLWRFYGGTNDKRGWAWGVAFMFLPTIIALTAGQIAPLVLLGAAAFLFLQQRDHNFWAGAAAMFLAVKPHLTYLFWIALILWSWRTRTWRVLVGAAAAALLTTTIPCWFNHDVLGQYVHTFLNRPPAQYRSPTLGTVLRLVFGEDNFRLQFLAIMPGLLWFSWYWRRHRQDWDWGERLPSLLLASMLTAPYGAWPFDLVVLLVPILQTATAVRRRNRLVHWMFAAAVYVGINAAALYLLVRDVEYFWFLWVTPTLAAAYLLLRQPKIPAAA